MNSSSTKRGGPGWAQPLRQILGIVVMVVVGGAVGSGIGWLVGDAIAAPELGDAGWLGLLIGLPLVVFLAILAHELGHLLGGRLVGFRFRLLVAGPIWLEREGDGLRLRLNRSLGMAGGVAASTPDDDRDLARRMLAMVAGGPLTSLALGGLALGGALLTGIVGLPGALAAMLGLCSLAIGLVTLVPMRSGGFNSDGARILMLLRGGPAAERWCAAAVLSNQYLSGRPRDLDPALLEQALAHSDSSLDRVSTLWMAYARALDRGEPAAAAAYLDEAMAMADCYPEALRPSLLLEAAFLAARHRGDPAGARELFERGRRGAFIEPYTLRRVEAAVLLAEGRPAEAAAAAEAGLAELRRRPRASAAAEADLLNATLELSHGHHPDR